MHARTGRFAHGATTLRATITTFAIPALRRSGRTDDMPKPLKRWDRRYFEMVAEVDFIHWTLVQMMEGEKATKRGLTPIEMMIDEAVDLDKSKIKTAKALIKRARFLRARLEKAI